MASTKTNFIPLRNLKKLSFAELTLKDKKSFKILLTLSREADFVKIPLASAQDPDSLQAYTIDVDTLYRVAFSLKKEQNITIGCVDVVDDDGVHLEYILHKNTSEDAIEYAEDAFEGKILKGDKIRPSSAKTASAKTASAKTDAKTDAKTSASKKEAEATLDSQLEKRAKKIASEFEKLLPNYCNIQPAKLSAISEKLVEMIIKGMN